MVAKQKNCNVFLIVKSNSEALLLFLKALSPGPEITCLTIFLILLAFPFTQWISVQLVNGTPS